MMSQRSTPHHPSCVTAPLQSNCRQRPYFTEDTNPELFQQPPLNMSSASPYSLSSQSYTHAHGIGLNAVMNSMTSQNALPHPHLPRPIVHPGYFGHTHHGEHTIHHTPGHLSAHQSMPGYSDNFRSDFNLGGRTSSDYTKPLSIATTFQNGFSGNSPSYPPFH